MNKHTALSKAICHDVVEAHIENLPIYERYKVVREKVDGILDAYPEYDYRKLQQQRDELQADAERYRWLREQHWNESPLAVVVDPKDAVKLGHDCPSGDRLDAMIAKARGDV